tara:strand:+ start:566 stop:751 length:186 start_codon:yes stop_codon:yes gene_type:complete
LNTVIWILTFDPLLTIGVIMLFKATVVIVVDSEDKDDAYDYVRCLVSEAEIDCTGIKVEDV